MDVGRTKSDVKILGVSPLAFRRVRLVVLSTTTVHRIDRVSPVCKIPFGTLLCAWCRKRLTFQPQPDIKGLRWDFTGRISQAKIAHPSGINPGVPITKAGVP